MISLILHQQFQSTFRPDLLHVFAFPVRFQVPLSIYTRIRFLMG